MCDVANLCMMYYFPGSKANLGICGISDVLDPVAAGILSESNLIRLYCHHNQAISYEVAMAWSGFYLAFLCFKNVVITHGVAARLASGVATSPHATLVAKLVPRLVNMCKELLEKRPPPQEDIELQHSRL
mmetsp:Transcript_4900/g.9726  ORF Transcript_4900/g.9726 Transcript_4900/m.9726 type:complete len:130 (-) Transcript_4900:117-506(-)